MSATSTTVATWTIDKSHSLAEFSVKHMMVSTTRGQFTNVSGSLTIDEANLANSTVEAVIAVDSITTRDEKRDEHLRSADFFDAANYPTIAFKSTSVNVKSDNELVITGDLTIRGVTRSVNLKTVFNGFNTSPWGARVVGFEADTEISRKEFGLEWNVALETGGVLVGDKVKIHLEVEASPAQ